MAVDILVVQPVMDVKTIVQQIVNVPVPGDVIEIVLVVVKHRVWGNVIQHANMNVREPVRHKVLMLPHKILTTILLTHRIHHLPGVAVAQVVLIPAHLHVKMDVKQHVKEVVKKIANQVAKANVIKDARIHVIVDVREGVIRVAKEIARADAQVPAKRDVQVALGLVAQDAIILA